MERAGVGANWSHSQPYQTVENRESRNITSESVSVCSSGMLASTVQSPVLRTATSHPALAAGWSIQGATSRAPTGSSWVNQQNFSLPARHRFCRDTTQ